MGRKCGSQGRAEVRTEDRLEGVHAIAAGQSYYSSSKGEHSPSVGSRTQSAQVRRHLKRVPLPKR